jgi:uncharacterized protein YbjT (DUF2867 family)
VSRAGGVVHVGATAGAGRVRGELEQPAALAPAVDGVDAVVFAHGGAGSPDVTRRVGYGGVAAVLRALDGRSPRPALMTSIAYSRWGAEELVPARSRRPPGPTRVDRGGPALPNTTASNRLDRG